MEVAVSNTGPGLSPEAMKQLFQPFFTTKPTGMGLGLSLSKSIVEAHGGEIWATPNPDQGVTFHFTASTQIGNR
ncbi:sensor histidine kinase [Nitrosococcus wardiae]|uniref:sensor histidine kinase n=1 Tax=Nitrosococcus wardiae TaxID=1814290 RepID=UPI00141B7098|nr:ATP-binding protein [Nitrosococcus wardiae]